MVSLFVEYNYHNHLSPGICLTLIVVSISIACDRKNWANGNKIINHYKNQVWTEIGAFNTLKTELSITCLLARCQMEVLYEKSIQFNSDRYTCSRKLSRAFSAAVVILVVVTKAAAAVKVITEKNPFKFLFRNFNWCTCIAHTHTHTMAKVSKRLTIYWINLLIKMNKQWNSDVCWKKKRVEATGVRLLYCLLPIWILAMCCNFEMCIKTV